MSGNTQTLQFDLGLDEKLISKPKTGGHWFWSSWVVLSLSSALCFATGNVIISSLSHLGIASIEYYSLGATIYCISYFIIKSRMNIPGRYVILKQNGQGIDYTLLMCYVVNAGFSAMIFFAISLTFYVCQMA